MGFDGKTLIHPNQIAPCNAAFSPSAEEVAQARKIIAAFDLPENKGKGVVQLDGRMVERMHADIARRTVAIADGDRGAVRLTVTASAARQSPPSAQRSLRRLRRLGCARLAMTGTHTHGRSALAFAS